MSEPSTEELRWLARIKELEWRADLARLVLAGDTAALSERLAQGPGAAAVPVTSADDAFAGYLDELERFCEWATPDPWTLDESGTGIMGPHCEPIVEECDAEFIVVARTALPKLIAKVRELQAKLDGSASVDAFNAIATSLGCPSWDYPGQLVRDVQALKERADKQQVELIEAQP